MTDMLKIAKDAKDAFLKMMNLDGSIKNEALNLIAKKLEENKEKIFKANQEDLLQAQELVNSGEINKATYDRLKLSETKLKDLIKGLDDLAKLENPVNKVLWQKVIHTLGLLGNFGKIPAKADDIANFIPSRLSALLMLFIGE